VTRTARLGRADVSLLANDCHVRFASGRVSGVLGQRLRTARKRALIAGTGPQRPDDAIPNCHVFVLKVVGECSLSSLPEDTDSSAGDADHRRGDWTGASDSARLPTVAWVNSGQGVASQLRFAVMSRASAQPWLGVATMSSIVAAMLARRAVGRFGVSVSSGPKGFAAVRLGNAPPADHRDAESAATTRQSTTPPGPPGRGPCSPPTPAEVHTPPDDGPVRGPSDAARTGRGHRKRKRQALAALSAAARPPPCTGSCTPS